MNAKIFAKCHVNSRVHFVACDKRTQVTSNIVNRNGTNIRVCEAKNPVEMSKFLTMSIN